SDTPLAVANSNLFGTKHTIYLKNSEQVLIELTRPLFTWSRDSEIKIIDKPALLANIDPNLMVSVLAMHCLHDIELIADVDDPSSPSSLKQELQTNIAEVVESQSTLQENPVALDDAQKKAVVNKVRAMYEQRYDDTALSEEEKIQQFVNFVTETVQAHVLTSAEEQAILTFLVERLK
ncbi:MAG TPA: hypothetical protein VHD33_05180, partial [Legionellaceae bacterium]|nr:hypothetical protein [Legionellaceae bacterium]